MTIKKILNVFTVLIASSILISFLCSCLNSDNDYFKSVGYYCEREEFQTVYFKFYSDKIEELRSKYGLECEKMVEIIDNVKSYYGGLGGDYISYEIYLYNDVYTINIRLSNGIDLGRFYIHLYFYGESELDLGNYEKQENPVNFINDFTNFAAFDTKTDMNHFEYLYNDAYNSSSGEESRGSSYIYHFDHCVGEVGYTVQLYNDSWSCYYKMLHDSNIDIKVNHYEFRGLLKSLSTN